MLVTIPNFKTITSISRKLSIPEEAIERAVQDMESMGLLKRDGSAISAVAQDIHIDSEVEPQIDECRQKRFKTISWTAALGSKHLSVTQSWLKAILRQLIRHQDGKIKKYVEIEYRKKYVGVRRDPSLRSGYDSAEKASLFQRNLITEGSR